MFIVIKKLYMDFFFMMFPFECLTNENGCKHSKDICLKKSD